MPDDRKVQSSSLRLTLEAGPSERTITLSYPRFLQLLDTCEDCARSLQHKLILLDDLYALLRGADDAGTRKVLTQNKQRAAAQMLAEVRAMRAETEKRTR